MRNLDETLLLDDSDLAQAITTQLQNDVGKRNTDKPDNTTDERNDSSQNGYQISKDELENFFNKVYTKSNPTSDSDEEEDEDEESDEEKDEKETDREDDNVSNENENADDDGSDDVLLDILRQEGLLDIPDDFNGELTENQLEEFKENTRIRKEQEARESVIEQMRTNFSNDPKSLELLDYFLTGESSANVPYFQDIQDYIDTYQSYNLKDEAVQRAILTEWLQDGLDPNNPAHQLRLNKVNAEVNDIIENLEGEKQAKIARDYFLTQLNSAKQQEIARVNAEKIARDNEAMIAENNRRNWHNQFQQHIGKTTWDTRKKQEVLAEQYGQVALQDGSKVPIYYAKEMMIKSNPELYAIYLDWLNTTFDLKQGKFVNTIESVKQSANRRLLDIANKKSSGTGGKRTSMNDQDNRKMQRSVVTREQLLGG